METFATNNRKHPKFLALYSLEKLIEWKRLVVLQKKLLLLNSLLAREIN